MQSGLDEDPQVALEELAGAVGVGGATELVNFVCNSADLPSIDDVLLYPDTAAVPERLSARWLFTTALAGHASDVNFGAISTYAKRLFDQGHPEVAAFLVRKCAVVNKAVTETSAYAAMLASPVGQLLR